jgi:hypothetical protein
VSFPAHIEHVLNTYGVRPDTKAALYDLYLTMGSDVLEIFGDLAERVASVAELQPEDTSVIRPRMVERFLAKNHPQWLAGRPTASFWHPRAAEGRASGAAIPLGELLPRAAHQAAGEESLPDGMLLFGRNAHYAGRNETISFDVIPRELDEAVAVGNAVGRQHTLPGSVGQTSGTFDSARGVALLWEVQPNVYKPAGERNREIAKVYRRHRNWHLATLAAAIEWLNNQRCTIFILRGAALATAHEANPATPVSEAIADMHERTVARVADAFGATLVDPADADEFALLDSIVMNHALRRHVLQNGTAGVLHKLLL